ncbi:MAG TPA: hypothetical protein VKR56_00325 [Candidatus Cybelea sp.]|nr:hypothetical protein [Candidatus Cybelea sp.]
MIDARLVNDITPIDIQLYLQGHRWNEQIVNDFLSVWSRAGLEQELFVPRRRDAIDYFSQLALLLRFLAELEDRQPLEVSADMRYTGADVIRLRIDTTAFDKGTIGFSKAAEIITQGERMLTAAARSAVHPQNFFEGRPPAKVTDYMETTRLGQTEQGSYVFIIVSPVTYPPATPQARTEPAIEVRPKPFARCVTETLSRSLIAIRGTAKAHERALTKVFEDLVDDGVSANLCETLSVIAETSQDRAVEVDFSWSPKAPNEEPRTKIVVPPMITPVLSDMAKFLKTVEPQGGFEVFGVVVKLSNQELGEGFDLALRGSIEGKERLVALELTEDERTVASTAWSTGQTVFTRGTLDKRYRPYRLLKPEVFQIMSV